MEFVTNFTHVNSNHHLHPNNKHRIDKVRVVEEPQLNIRVKGKGRQLMLIDLVKYTINSLRMLELLMVQANAVIEHIKALSVNNPT